MFNLEVTDRNKNYPNRYGSPKLHKNPTKAMFITTLPKCTVKPILKNGTAALKLI